MTQKFQFLVTCYHEILTLMCENKVQWWGTTGGHWASANRQNVANERSIFTSTTIKYELLLLSLLLLLPWFLRYRLRTTWWSSVLIFFCKHHSVMAKSFFHTYFNMLTLQTFVLSFTCSPIKNINSCRSDCVFHSFDGVVSFLFCAFSVRTEHYNFMMGFLFASLIFFLVPFTYCS